MAAKGPIKPEELRKFMRSVSVNINLVTVFVFVIMLVKIFGR